jgi:hypothetical protein
VKIVYGFGANVAFIMALLFATMWAAYSTQAVRAMKHRLLKEHLPITSPAPAASPTGHSNIIVTYRTASKAKRSI